MRKNCFLKEEEEPALRVDLEAEEGKQETERGRKREGSPREGRQERFGEEW